MSIRGQGRHLEAGEEGFVGTCGQLQPILGTPEGGEEGDGGAPLRAETDNEAPFLYLTFTLCA